MKVVLGGLAKLRDLEDVPAYSATPTTDPQLSRGRWGTGRRGTARQIPVMPPAVLRTLPFGTAVLLLRHTRPLVVDLQAWTERRDAAALTEQRGEVEAAMAGHRPLGSASFSAATRRSSP